MLLLLLFESLLVRYKETQKDSQKSHQWAHTGIIKRLTEDSPKASQKASQREQILFYIGFTRLSTQSVPFSLFLHRLSADNLLFHWFLKENSWTTRGQPGHGFAGELRRMHKRIHKGFSKGLTKGFTNRLKGCPQQKLFVHSFCKVVRE